jgi:putative hemolysin
MEPFRTSAVAIVLAGVVVAVACGGGSSPSSSEDERGSIGVPSSAADYCQRLGFTNSDSQCRFPDGTSCEEWSFFRGQCGQAHSYCNQHGGSISSVTEDAGSFTEVHGVCSLNGKQCDEGTFMGTGMCG